MRKVDIIVILQMNKKPEAQRKLSTLSKVTQLAVHTRQSSSTARQLEGENWEEYNNEEAKKRAFQDGGHSQ